MTNYQVSFTKTKAGAMIGLFAMHGVHARPRVVLSYIPDATPLDVAAALTAGAREYYDKYHRGSRRFAEICQTIKPIVERLTWMYCDGAALVPSVSVVVHAIKLYWGMLDRQKSMDGTLPRSIRSMFGLALVEARDADRAVTTKEPSFMTRMIPVHDLHRTGIAYHPTAFERIDLARHLVLIFPRRYPHQRMKYFQVALERYLELSGGHYRNAAVELRALLTPVKDLLDDMESSNNFDALDPFCLDGALRVYAESAIAVCSQVGPRLHLKETSLKLYELFNQALAAVRTVSEQ